MLSACPSTSKVAVLQRGASSSGRASNWNPDHSDVTFDTSTPAGSVTRRAPSVPQHETLTRRVRSGRTRTVGS
jgi:hypothetical protein